MQQAQSAQAKTTLFSEMWPVTLSLALGIVLVCAKFLAYYLTKSAAIFSDALENVVNVMASAFALYAIYLSHRPADEEHPYGHGKVEFMSAGFEGGMILMAAAMIVVRACESLALRQAPTDLVVGLWITLASMILCAAVGVLLRHRGDTAGSITLQAEGVHLIVDSVTALMVLTGLLVVKLTHIMEADAIAALFVGIWMVRQAAKLLRRAAAGLMDEQDALDADRLNRILTRHCGPSGEEPRICSYHKLRHRHSGRHHWVDFHIQVPANWNVERGHQVATSIEMEIERELGDCSASAHVEQCIDADCQRCKADELSLIGRTKP
jgi:cation diffusion facilitator family transporter